MKNFIDRIFNKIGQLFNSKVVNIEAADFYSPTYWEERYKKGGTSGDGSYGRLAIFKAKTINTFLHQKGMNTVIEFGCGDGNQLGLMDYKQYIGLDISPTAVNNCIEKFSADRSKKFIVYTSDVVEKIKQEYQIDVALSLDVIYHIVEDQIFNQYMQNLFSCSDTVIVYSTNYNAVDSVHVRHRKFTDWVEKFAAEWKLSDHLKNPYPGQGNQESLADFFIFTRDADSREITKIS